jgi:anaerobic magnesium-protoporphyrin IX monomethyl ester cyclase
MVKVALVNPPIPNGTFRHQPYLPIGLAYLASALEKHGNEVKVFDCAALGINFPMLKRQLADFRAEIVGITSMTPTINSAFSVAKTAKEAQTGTCVVIGGPHTTFMDEQIVDSVRDIDVVVRGEGEQTIIDIAQRIGDHKDLYDVAGITLRKSGKVVRTIERKYVENLDELPFPSIKHFDLEKYKIFGKRIFPIITSRGCPFQCSFCITSAVFGKRMRMRTPKNVVDELEALKKANAADAFTFFDSTFTFDVKRAHKICDEIIERKIDLPWDCQTRVDQINPEILAKLKKAGCEMVSFGIESGCQRTLDSINKKTSVLQNERGIRMIKKAGLAVVATVIIGLPGETKKEMMQTLRFIERLKPDDIFVCIATPYPGTELYETIKKNGWKMSDDWSKYDTFNPVFENPLATAQELLDVRKSFYDDFYSRSYLFRHIFKRNFYNRIMARTALSHYLWNIKPVSASKKKKQEH